MSTGAHVGYRVSSFSWGSIGSKRCANHSRDICVFGTAQSSLDRPIAPPPQVPYNASNDDRVQYAILALLDDASKESPAPGREHSGTGCVGGFAMGGLSALQRHVPPAPQALPTVSAATTASWSDADEKSTVYNVIDWEKTQVLNDMRKQLETNRHTSISNAGSVCGQK
jgi:hypothetical protein